MVINWNEAAVKSMTKEQFIADHQHYKDDVDLDKEYDKIVPPKKVKATEGTDDK